MRVLWFTVTPSLYGQNNMKHNGNGWEASLERIVANNLDVELGIAFVTDKYDNNKVTKGNVTYYPMNLQLTSWQKLKARYTSAEEDQLVIARCIDVINDFTPDVIQVFGSEWCYGLVAKHTNIPVVIHFQGCWPPYYNAKFPPGFSRADEYLTRWYNPKALLGYYLEDHKGQERARREEKILRINKHFMGRTRWDKALVRLYSPDANYYYCSEALRSEFVNQERKWEYKEGGKFIIVTAIGMNSLKGLDVVLKTAKLIKENSNLDFEWRILGPVSVRMMRLFKRKTATKDINLVMAGRCEASEVLSILLTANVYVHCAYIDNSPNMICEAQYMGVPVISTNVGGIPTLFAKEYDESMLVPTNDPYYLASKIIELSQSKDLQQKLSELNSVVA